MNISIWPGSSSFSPGNTPFGFYDYDYQFQCDADRVAIFCSRRLGFPVVDIELQDINFYAAFEEAITTYGNELYAYKIRQDYLSLEGASTGSNLNHSLVTPNLANIIRLSEQYGTEAGVGGNTNWYSGSLYVSASQQDYDLGQWASSSLGISGSDIEIKRIFYEGPPAIIKYFDPYAGTGMGMMNMMESFGWGNYSPAINFMLMPISFDIQKLQAIEFSDQIRRSNYSFELINNKLRIFPIPKEDYTLYFQYLLKSERLANSITNSPTVITNVSNVPYDNPKYTQINSVGRSWIFEYTLVLVKEILGYVRGKFNNIPIPGDNVTLNSSDLLNSYNTEKASLIEKLRGYLEETSREKLLERRSNEADYRQKELNQVPFPIYII